MLAHTFQIHIVVLNWNNYADSKECLISLNCLTYPNYKVILVDNGSIDGSGDKLSVEFPDIIYICTGENLGYAGGNNVGMKYALANGADIVLVLNNDVVVESADLLQNISLAMNNKNVGIVGPRIYDYFDRTHRLDIYDSSFFYNAIDKISLNSGKDIWFTENGMALKSVTRVSGCAIAFSRELLEKVGLFDERFFLYAEEIDLCFRAIISGYCIANIVDERAKLFHKSKIGYVPPRAWYYITRNMQHLINNNFNKSRWFLFHLLNVAVVFRRIIYLLKKHDLKGIKACLSGFSDGLLGRYGQKIQ